jgi:hypothetical protein
MAPDGTIPRLAVALVWLYQGLWCKLLGGCPGHRAIVQAVPWIGERGGQAFLLGLGALETGLALWVLSGWRPRAAALVQTGLLIGMNGGGLIWGREHIAAPGAMITQNLAFLALAWIVAGPGRTDDGETGSPWRRGRLDGKAGPPQLLFGRMYEDWRIEAVAFRSGGRRIFCIASSGCTALALAACGFRVTAVDVNPVQIEYLRARLAGEPARDGVAERWMAWLRRGLPLLGLRERDLRAFLELADPAEQVRVWRERLATRRFRAALRCALHPAVLRLTHGARFVRSLPPRFDRIVRGRLERTWALHPNRDNPYAWRLLLGEEPPAGAEEPAVPIAAFELVCADAAEYLESCPPASFDGFSLSNVLDAAPMAYVERLLTAVRRAAAPGAVVVLRSFQEPALPAPAEWVIVDRSLLWGSLDVWGVPEVATAAQPAAG